MSRINFDSFRRDVPDLNEVWGKLEGWVDTHPSQNALDPRRLAVDLSPVPAFDLARALSALVQAGAITRVYRVRSPDGAMLPGEYQNLSEIPAELPSRTFEYFEVEPTNIVSIYRLS